MSILMPEGIEWLTNSWISRGFFDDAIILPDIIPKIKNNIRFCIDADVDTLDLRDASIDVMGTFNSMVNKVINYRLLTKGDDFHLPEYFPVYISKLEELRNLTCEVLDKMTLSTKE